jgi:hypothetical protein|tara:strand:- start:476 stop:646 length:171 start_codon:yes stop_codon:yes gene_type:complete
MTEHELKLQISNAKKIVLLSEPNSWREQYWSNVVTQLEYILDNSSLLINTNRKITK